jgi:hypothetical protein
VLTRVLFSSGTTSATKDTVAEKESVNVVAPSPAVKDAKEVVLSGAASALLGKLLAPAERHAALSFVSDVYLCERKPSLPDPHNSNLSAAYIYWTILTSLAPSFFYYSVWQLGVAGQEVTLLATLSPILLAIPPINSWATSRGGKTTLWIGGLVGIASYMSRFPIIRMLCIGVANGCLSMVKALEWSNPDKAAYEGLRECIYYLDLDWTDIAT